MVRLSFKTSPKPLPPYIRQRLTLQRALLINPQKYINNVRFNIDTTEKVIPEREIPAKELFCEKTQTQDVMDAETNTKSRFASLESKKSKLITKCATLAKEARIVSRSPYVEIARRIKRDGIISQKSIPALAAAADSKRDVPGIKRRRGYFVLTLLVTCRPFRAHNIVPSILKKVLEEVKIEGMCSQGTATEGKRPTLERILKENHLFLKYSKNCKAKKKRVRMEKQPAFSYFSRRPEIESVQSLEASADEGPNKVMLGDEGDEDSAVSSEDCLERKPARFALRSSGELDAAPGRGLSVLVCNMSSAPQLNDLRKLPGPPKHLETPQLEEEAYVEPPQDSPKKPRCRVPRDRLYFKNMDVAVDGYVWEDIIINIIIIISLLK